MVPKFSAWEPDTEFMNNQVLVTSNRFGDGEVLVEATDGFGWIEVNGTFTAGDEDWLYNIKDYCVVCGNIYENPELLEPANEI
ncbi:hypothetical protein [Enterococcus casseliflavus]|uniref:hypothetical protein n=1 Tax=Enterococcus casseliflavus TaxID=37734 RepID=UPI00325A72AB